MMQVSAELQDLFLPKKYWWQTDLKIKLFYYRFACFLKTGKYLEF